MRIIAGRFRGRKLKDLKAEGVRPTLDRVRENLFNIIAPNIKDAVFLDLFSGSGAVGFEALSRGAKEVVFCDKSKAVAEHLKLNAKMLGENVTVINSDYKSTLLRLGKKGFDIIYLDPPYEFDESEVLYELSKSKILDNETLVIYEHNSEKPFKNQDLFIITGERKYGIATLTFLRKKDD